ncbi:MAG: hypothetical protein GXP42_06040 [Chloroflexi bacterium]|nr:hypothetical protein [Chloroflexota bacterium]
MIRSFFPLAAVVAATMFLAACAPAAAPPETEPRDQAAIDAAVQATLTAVAQAQPNDAAPSPTADSQTPTAPTVRPTATTAPPPSAASIVLPPEVKDFEAVINPVKTKGDANAPVVMYEWSDYT